MKAQFDIKRLIPPFVVIAVAIGLSQAMASIGQLASAIQIVAFSIIGIFFVGYLDLRKNNQMQGCMTILAFGFAPLLAFMLAGLNWLSLRSELNLAIGWAGNYRLPALLFLIFALISFFTIGLQRMKRKKRIRLRDVIEIAFSMLGLGIFGGLIGCVWLALAFGIRMLGL